MTFKIDDIPYEEQYDEFGEVSGCKDPEGDTVDCVDCGYKECPERGKKGED